MIRRLLAAALLLAAIAPASAQERGQAGDFDFYVLSLSWSPTYCADRGARADSMQCAGPRPFAFVLHGLWPQHDRGFPSSCGADGRGPSRRTVDGMLDVMPSPGLVRHQWRKHGTCSGLDPAGYFAKARAAYDKVTIPAPYRALDRWLTTSPADVERAFIAANPGLNADMVAVDCARRNLREVRICMSKDLEFRACGEVDRRACRADRVALPPMRGE